MASPNTPAWLQALSTKFTDAQAAADRPVVAVILDGADEGDSVYSLHLGVTSSDVEAAALAILGDILEHYRSLPADQLCEGCKDRIARVQAAVAALTEGDAAPVVAAQPGARLQ
jgi:hypothetical protein